VLDSLSFSFTPSQESHFSTFLRETVCGRFPNAAIATCDNGHFALQPSWHIASLLTWLPLGLLPNAQAHLLPEAEAERSGA
jgi:hypothetical protein